MSGALKHFFDLVYYPTLSAKVGATYGLYVHGNSDTVARARAVESIVKGLGWRRVHDDVTVIDKPDQERLDACCDPRRHGCGDAGVVNRPHRRRSRATWKNELVEREGNAVNSADVLVDGFGRVSSTWSTARCGA